MRRYSDMRVGLAGAKMPPRPAATRRANRHWLAASRHK